MIKDLLFSIIILVSGIQPTLAYNQKSDPITKVQTIENSTRIVELNHFWFELSRTVQKGNFERYKAAYHEDAVIVLVSAETKPPCTKSAGV